MIDMYNHVADPLNSLPEGGVTRITTAPGYYDYDNGGVWVEGQSERIPLAPVNIQPASRKTIEFMVAMGGTANPRDIRDVYVNDGVNYCMPSDTGRTADHLEFSDGIELREWRVMHSDNRPWNNYSHLIVERVRE